MFNNFEIDEWRKWFEVLREKGRDQLK